MHKRLSEEYHGVTEKACVLFLADCEEYHLRKAKKSVKSLVVKPISSTRFLSRCQVDLIDFRDMSETHNMADCGIPYKWLLVCPDTPTAICREYYNLLFHEISPPSTSQAQVSCRSCRCIGRYFLTPRSSSYPPVRQWR